MRDSPRVKQLVVTLALVVVGCGNPAKTGKVKVVGMTQADFGSLAAFDGSDCVGDWDKQALDGTIWTLDHQFPEGLFAGVIRFDGASVIYGGVASDTTILDRGNLFFFRAESSRVAQRTFYACSRPAPGQIDGAVVSCTTTGGCTTGTFHAVKLERRAGEADASGLTELAEFPFPQSITANVRVDAARSLAVLARYEDGLYTMKLDPGPPYVISQLGHGATEESVAMMTREIYNDVKLLDVAGKHYALMASSAHGVVVWDITDPAQPSLVAHARDKHNIHTLALVGTTAYLADYNISGMAIVDFSDPTAPRDVSELVVNEAYSDATVFLHDLYVEPGRAYLDYWGAGLVIADVSVPEVPVELGRVTYPRMKNHSVWVTTINGRKVALTGDEDFTAHLRSVDVTDPAAPRIVGEWGQDRPQISAHNVLIEGDTAYVAYYQDGLRMFKLSDTAAPAPIGWFNTWSPSRTGGTSFYEGAIGVDKIGKTIYLADVARGLIVLTLP
jgi:hypothetical protein